MSAYRCSCGRSYYQPHTTAECRARVARYTDTISRAVLDQFRPGSAVASSLAGFDWVADVARAVIAVADAEQAELRAAQDGDA